MRIGVEAYFNLDRKTGIANYALRLIEELKKAAAEDEGSGIEIVEYRPRENSVFNFSKIRNGLLRKILYFKWLNVVLPFLAAKDKIDVLISPNYVRPYFLPCKSVAVFHDANMFAAPQFFDSTNALFRGMIRYSAKKADAVITPSESARKEAVGRLGLPPQKVFCVHHGIDKKFFEKIPEKRVAEFRKSKGFPENAFVCVGTVEKRKNLESVFRAMEILSGNGIECFLAVVGKDGFGAAEIRRKALASGVHGKVKFFGYADDEELLLFYRSAKALVYVSHYEGFGLPLLEAMASGTPVIAADNTSMPEVCGNAAVFVNDGRPEEIAFAMKKILADAGLRKRLSEKGVSRAKKFGWKDCCQKTIEAARKALASGQK
ncbi:MAG: glycosyltransferase family 4 protein [Candidatus Diapherotrites archaeon]|nr:glycosyltransferase family 4 protein [Candidatus Diapherotrites archaeon]